MALYSEAELRESIKRATDHFIEEIGKLRAGRVRAEMFENIPVMAYNMSNPLKGVASINVDGPMSVVIQPWDPNVATNVYKAIQEANLGFNPVQDGTKIRISLPPLTEETRKQTVKELGSMLEDSKATIRQVRHKFNTQVDGLEGVSEDEQKRDRDQIQKQIDAATEELVKISAAKQQELMSL